VEPRNACTLVPWFPLQPFAEIPFRGQASFLLAMPEAPGHRHVARNEHSTFCLENFLARFAIRTVIHPWFSGDIIPVIKKLPPVIGQRVSFLRGWFAQKQVKEPEYRAVPEATDARGALGHEPDQALFQCY
jgi:hypothetical protein